MVRETINKMPSNVVATIEGFRKDYGNPALRRDVVRGRLAGYVKGLRDAGLITERERQILFVYGVTVGFDRKGASK